MTQMNDDRLSELRELIDAAETKIIKIQIDSLYPAVMEFLDIVMQDPEYKSKKSHEYEYFLNMVKFASPNPLNNKYYEEWKQIRDLKGAET